MHPTFPRARLRFGRLKWFSHALRYPGKIPVGVPVGLSLLLILVASGCDAKPQTQAKPSPAPAQPPTPPPTPAQKPEDFQEALSKATQLLSDKKTQEAWDALKPLTLVRPQDPQLLYLTALVLAAKEDLPGAIQTIRRIPADSIGRIPERIRRARGSSQREASRKSSSDEAC